jgi:hypothetical protein
MEGTHPQQWTPPLPRRVYSLDILRGGEDGNNKILPQSIIVEHYITHNGDFDFYRVNGKAYDLERIQKWLAMVLHHPMPASVDSCAVAGMVDLLRARGSFGLCARYAVCLGLSTSQIQDNMKCAFPPYSHFETIGKVFEDVLAEMLKGGGASLSNIDESPSVRESFAWRVVSKLKQRKQELLYPLASYILDSEEEQENGGGASLHAFCLATIRAFFDNDLFAVTKTFLANATGSFGLCITSSLDAHRQICLAARGQTMSIAFYPRTGIILYGSEQAAVKAGMSVSFPGNVDELDHSLGDVDNDALRLDLDGKLA